MLTAEDIRRLALALPEAYEDTHRRAPAFRVAMRIFGMLPLGEPRLVVKLDREDQLNMIGGHPGLVGPGRHYSHHGWTIVRYEECDADLAETILRLAWTHVAPCRLVKATAVAGRLAAPSVGRRS